jgi:hypothetical protein
MTKAVSILKYFCSAALLSLLVALGYFMITGI